MQKEALAPQGAQGSQVQDLFREFGMGLPQNDSEFGVLGCWL